MRAREQLDISVNYRQGCKRLQLTPRSRRHSMAAEAPTVGWIGTGRMGYQLARRLLNAGYDVATYNRTRAKCEPLTEFGAKIVDTPAELADRDIVFIMVSADKDLEAVISGPGGLLTGEDKPRMVADLS